jgi:hypothetical protein
MWSFGYVMGRGAIYNEKRKVSLTMGEMVTMVMTAWINDGCGGCPPGQE